MTANNPESNIQHPTSAAPYTALAAGYDLVMAHVDYEFWAVYAHRRLQEHHPDLRTILELGCGTGSLALALQSLGDYAYLATDRSDEMIRIARRKAALEEAAIDFDIADFTDFEVEQPVDAIVLLYDGLNYLLEPEPIADVLRCAYNALQPGGLFLFDQSTPANSLNNDAFFEDQGRGKNFAYVRRSRYDADKRLHITAFDLTLAGQTFHEEHMQRAYDMSELRALIAKTPFEEVAAYDSFSTAPATDASERIHWVLRRPA